MDKRLPFLLLVAESALLIVSSFMPGYSVQTGLPVLRAGDLEHLLAYTAYGLLAAAVLSNKFSGKRLILSVALLSLSIAVLTESIQLFVPGRMGDPIDASIDVAGSVIGLFLYRIRKSRTSSS